MLKQSYPVEYVTFLTSYFKHLNSRRKKGIYDYKKFIEFQKIIKNQALTTFFQPIIDLQTGKNLGYEALNRPPVSSPFPTTEEFYDFIGQTDHVFLFECMCRNMSLRKFIENQKRNSLEDGLLLFINIHPQVLMDSNYRSGETLQLLKELKISPKQIIFELTEKKAVSDFVAFENILSNYRSQGFRIAIDDAGSGYNSLKTLIYLKPEFIKLDKSLIQGIDNNPAQQYMLSLLMDFARQSNTFVIAEGIEREGELTYIREQNIHYGQGYALGKPKKELVPGCLPTYINQRTWTAVNG